MDPSRTKSIMDHHIYNMTSIVLTYMIHLQLVQSVYLYGSFLPALSDCKDLDNVLLVKEQNDHSIKTGTSVQHKVFL